MGSLQQFIKRRVISKCALRECIDNFSPFFYHHDTSKSQPVSYQVTVCNLAAFFCPSHILPCSAKGVQEIYNVSLFDFTTVNSSVEVLCCVVIQFSTPERWREGFYFSVFPFVEYADEIDTCLFEFGTFRPYGDGFFATKHCKYANLEFGWKSLVEYQRMRDSRERMHDIKFKNESSVQQPGLLKQTTSTGDSAHRDLPLTSLPSFDLKTVSARIEFSPVILNNFETIPMAIVWFLASRRSHPPGPIFFGPTLFAQKNIFLSRVMVF